MVVLPSIKNYGRSKSTFEVAPSRTSFSWSHQNVWKRPKSALFKSKSYVDSREVERLERKAKQNNNKYTRIPMDSEKDRRSSQNKSQTDESIPKAMRVDEQMKHEHLLKLEKIFNAGEEGEGGLSMKEFRAAIKETMGGNVSDTALDRLFMKVDNNCDGTVEWDEYITYMLLEYQEKKNMHSKDQDCPFPNPTLVLRPSNHMEPLCSIRLLQAYSTRHKHGFMEPDDAATRYITMSREGVLNIWNLDWRLQKSCVLDGAKGSPNASNSKGLVVTDMVCMPNCNTICVASTEYEVTFYTLTSNLLQKRFQIKDLNDCALTMDYSFDPNDPKNSTLIWGDASGSIVVIRFFDNPNLSLFITPLCINNKISLIRLLCGVIPGLKTVKFRDVHTDWVQQVKYHVNRKGQECIISGCNKSRRALFFADITNKSTDMPKQTVTVNRKAYFPMRKGVLCFSYDPEWNLIVTGSRNGDIRVWNPYVVNKSCAALKGHCTAVVQVLVRVFDHQFISISKDKDVRIWDLRDYTCKQSIEGKTVGLGRLPVSAAFFSERHKELVMATSRIGVMYPHDILTYKKQVQTHQQPVIGVLYNPLFNLIVTGGEDSIICMWDVKTGVKQMQFSTEPDMKITSMAFDPTYRRLLTGGQNGEAILWNFNNGAKLHSLEKIDDKEITDIVFADKQIALGGWNRQIKIHHDSRDARGYEVLKKKHNDDILSLDYHKEECLLASSSFDGDVFIWSMDAKEILMTFNMYKSLLPQHLHGYGDKDKTQSTKTKKREEKRRLKRALEPSATWLPDDMPWLSSNPQHFSDSESDFISNPRPCSSISSVSIESEESDKTKPKDIVDHAIYKVLFLQTRPCREFVGSLITASSNGWLCMWSIHHRGGMMGYFNGSVKQKCKGFVTTMITDPSNKILVTGDSKGYIKTWKLSEYCNEDDMQKQDLISCSSSTQASHSSLALADLQYLPTDVPPTMLMSVRGHTKSVTSLATLSDLELLASASIDGSVRLWTEKGQYVGTFGQTLKWNIELPQQIHELSTAIPYDIRRIASPTTLRTAKGLAAGQNYHIKGVTHALHAIGKMKALKLKQERQQNMTIRQRLTSLKHSLLEESSLSHAEDLNQLEKPSSITIWMDDVPYFILSRKNAIDQVNKTFQRIESEGMTSSILGKVNYKPKRRHRQASIEKNIRWCQTQAVVYNTLPYVKVTPPGIPIAPEYIRMKLMKHPFNSTRNKCAITNELQRTVEEAKQKRANLPPIASKKQLKDEEKKSDKNTSSPDEQKPSPNRRSIGKNVVLLPAIPTN